MRSTPAHALATVTTTQHASSGRRVLVLPACRLPSLFASLHYAACYARHRALRTLDAHHRLAWRDKHDARHRTARSWRGAISTARPVSLRAPFPSFRVLRTSSATGHTVRVSTRKHRARRENDIDVVTAVAKHRAAARAVCRRNINVNILLRIAGAWLSDAPLRTRFTAHQHGMVCAILRTRRRTIARRIVSRARVLAASRRRVSCGTACIPRGASAWHGTINSANIIVSIALVVGGGTRAK